MTRDTKIILATLACTIAVASISCSGGGGAAKTATPAPRPTTIETPAGRYPLTITDALGRSVTVAREPVAVAAIGPLALNYLYLDGGASNTRESSVTDPPSVLSAVDIGPAAEPNFDAIRATKPDVIIADAATQAALQQRLEALGAPVVFVGAKTYTDVADGLRLVGSIVNRTDLANKRATDSRTTSLAISGRLPASRARVLILVGTPAGYVAATQASYAGDLLATIKAKNIAADRPEIPGRPGFAKLTLEEILAAKPNVVLTITEGLPGTPTIADAINGDPLWAAVPAITDKRVFEIDAQMYLGNPGLNGAQALLDLAKLLYPAVFAQ